MKTLKLKRRVCRSKKSGKFSADKLCKVFRFGTVRKRNRKGNQWLLFS